MINQTQKNKGRKIFWVVISIFVIALAGYTFYRWWNRGVVTAKTAAVTRGTITAVVSANGIVDAPVYELGTKIGGKIGAWKVKENDDVKKGQLLAVFDNYEEARNDFQRSEELFSANLASEQTYDAAKTIFEASRIVAPAEGVVAKINFWEGETVIPGSPAVVIVNYKKSWVEAQIDEIDIGNVNVGDKVKITSDVYPDKIFEGEIFWIAPLAELRRVGGRVKIDEESYVFPCKIKFLGNHEELKINMNTDVEIVTQKKDGVLLAPREALVSKDDTATVFVVKKNRVYQTKIDIGIRSYTNIEVLSGIFEGNLIAISNVSKLKDKGRIKIDNK